MARLDARHDAGAPGPWFVDDRCIDCDAARQVAPGLIDRHPGDGVSFFVRQPETDDEVEMAWRAVMVCPTRSVGHETLSADGLRAFVAGYPAETGVSRSSGHGMDRTVRAGGRMSPRVSSGSAMDAVSVTSGHTTMCFLIPTGIA